MKIQKKDLNEIKRKLFGNLEREVKITDKNPKTVTFMRETDFGTTCIYTEYDFKDKRINQIYINGNKRKKILYDRTKNISDSQELNKYNLIK